MNLIVRADVQGSFEVVKQSLESLSNREVVVKVIGGGVGPISDSDINLASSSNGFVIGFGMRPVTSARRLSEAQGVDVKTYMIIYELINDYSSSLTRTHIRFKGNSVLNSSLKLIPEFPSRKESSTVSLLFPKQETRPIPVTTTRFM